MNFTLKYLFNSSPSIFPLPGSSLGLRMTTLNTTAVASYLHPLQSLFSQKYLPNLCTCSKTFDGFNDLRFKYQTPLKSFKMLCKLPTNQTHKHIVCVLATLNYLPFSEETIPFPMLFLQLIKTFILLLFILLERKICFIFFKFILIGG